MANRVLRPRADRARIAGYAWAALALATLAAYWTGFAAWCGARGVIALPAALVTVAA
jgi:hypothetical protein